MQQALTARDERALGDEAADLAALPAARRSGRPAGLTLILVFWGYPFLWALGLQEASWPVCASFLGVWLFRRRDRLVVPSGFGIWLLFLGWTLASALVLQGGSRILAWGYRESLYLSGTVILVFLVNTSPKELSTRRMNLMVLALWAATVLTGLFGLFEPQIEFKSLAELVLPHSLTNIPFVFDQIHPRFGDQTELLGVTRPTAMYSYTNSWGAALGMLTPMALYARQFLLTRRARLSFWIILVLSLIPTIVSVNRGLWVSLVVAGLVVGGRGVLLRRPAVFAGVLGTGAIIAAVVWFSPLLDILQKRLQTPNTGTRQVLIQAAIDLVAGSPVVGYGAPVTVTTISNTNNVSVGTHGQLWTLLVSHGYPGAALYLGFFLFCLIATRHLGHTAMWLQATIVVFITQALFYNALPVPLVLVMLAVALGVREHAALGIPQDWTGVATPRSPLGPRQPIPRKYSKDPVRDQS